VGRRLVGQQPLRGVDPFDKKLGIFVLKQNSTNF